jgi:alkylation response protein AidB-like acyl-CoA dehydrogenase
MEHAHRRETFGKKLIDHPVIRFKMVRSFVLLVLFVA